MSSVDPQPPAPAAAPSPASLLWLLPVALVAAWWVHDLSYQWASLVDYKFGWMVVLLAAYLVWERWPSRPRDDAPGGFGVSFALALLGFPAVLLAELYRIGLARTPTSSMALSIGCALFIAAFVRLIWGRRRCGISCSRCCSSSWRCQFPSSSGIPWCSACNPSSPR